MSKLSNYAGAGKETITDVKTAYLKIAQKQSDEINKNKPAYIQGLQEGQFFNSGTKKIYGETIRVVVFATRKSYAIIDDDNQFKGSSPVIEPTWVRDAQGILRTQEGYRAQLNYGYIVALYDDVVDAVKAGKPIDTMVFTLKATSISAAREWNTALQQLQIDGASCPIFGGIWEVRSVYQENKKGSWYSVDAAGGTCVGFIDDDVVDAVAATSHECIEMAKSAGVIASTPHAAIAQDADLA